MDNSEIYKSLNEHEGLKLPSYMGIIPRNSDQDFLFDQEKLKAYLENNKEFKLKAFNAAEKSDNLAIVNDFSFDVDIDFEGTNFEVNISAFKLEGLDLRSFSFANTVDEESLDEATKPPYYLEVKTIFADDPMSSFLFQLKVLNTIVPDACLVIDFSSMRLLSPHWLKMTAASNIPPSPNYLYIIHAVYDEKGEDTYYWMHTHGLHRCGSMELELVNIKAGAQQMHNLINTAANLFIIEHYKENESFQVGYDGLGINLCWLRWEEALKEFPTEILGGINDRKEENDEHNVHAEPSGVLFAVEDGNYTSPEIFASTLADNPIFFIRDNETQRMSALAKERFHVFEKTFKQYGGKEEEEEKKGFLGKIFGKKKEEEKSWRFLVKLGLSTDDATKESDREHLWFEVKEIDGNTIKGELLNQPYWIAGLNEGDIKSYPIEEVLTDWIIYGPKTDYTPDSVYMLTHK